jgi:methyl-accepting chemotaxis protein
MTVFIIVLTLINIGLWLVFLLRFKRLFSTDKIIEKTKTRINEIEKQINTVTDRNLYIAKETTKNIETMLNDVDRKMELFREATQRLRSMIREADKINRLSNQSLSLHQDFSKIAKVNPAKKNRRN